MSLSFITSAIGIVLNIMSTVYFGIFAKKFNPFHELIVYNVTFQILMSIQLIINCFIHEKILQFSTSNKIVDFSYHFNCSTPYYLILINKYVNVLVK